jgi:hypothetical protein
MRSHLGAVNTTLVKERKAAFSPDATSPGSSFLVKKRERISEMARLKKRRILADSGIEEQDD